MKRPTLEVADIIRCAGKGFIERNRPHLGWQQLKVLRAIQKCRTAALGVISISAPDAAIAPSPSSPAGTGIVPSAKPTPATNGSRLAPMS
jgi:hypothetical protein